MQGISGNEDSVISGVVYGHVSSESGEYKRVHGRYEFGEMN